jgi:hypothetical protein
MTIVYPGRRALLLGLSALLLGACAGPPPQYQDALTGLHNLPGAAAPLDVPVTAGPTVALVVGANIEKVLQQKADGDKILKSFGPLTNTMQVADSDPQYIITGAISILRQRYPQLQPVDDLATAAQRKFATTIVLDFTLRPGSMSGKQTTANLVAIAFDARQQPLSRIETSGTTTIGYPAYTTRLREASDIALAAFKEKVDSLWR